ncbi:uncharacterized protein LOC113229569 [Hyposmocoma kahamanoa]|uniref:uncharacterized protein LOC113229569 n=1 Tax=Hyposmocoma kahamanoa TaxID=1477025 RepID=UPI000E6D6DBA|nr:uncharacterized protein LOC113229569 [Hyposmocoma kahamanoa]
MRKQDVTTPAPLLTQTVNKISKHKLFSKFSNHKNTPEYEPVPVINAFNVDPTAPHNVVNNNRNPPPVFKFNNTIQNINVIRTSKPKKRVIQKRCPSLRPRQKKQLNLNQTANKRFLEIFEVVEFDHVACTSSSGLEGTCLPENECQESGGSTMGSCADGYGTCCVTQFSCDDRSAAATGWFTNPGFPSTSTTRLSCTLALDKTSGDIQQIRLDFVNFELLPPNVGTCEQDQFVVSGQNSNNIIPILCGVNTGQHIYIEVGNAEGPITLSVQTVSSDNRLFSIKVTQLGPSDELAPSGCLQYYKESQGNFESFNYRDKSDIAIPRSPSYLNNLNYAMCLERSSSTCSVTYTNAGVMQIVNYDSDGLLVIPPGQAGVETFNCPTDWLLIAAIRLCGDRLNDGSVLQDFALDAPVTDISAGPIVVWFRSDSGYIGRGFKIQYQQNEC